MEWALLHYFMDFFLSYHTSGYLGGAFKLTLKRMTLDLGATET